jgi:hypothetical protein
MSRLETSRSLIENAFQVGGNVKRAVSLVGLLFLALAGLGAGIATAAAQAVPEDYQQVLKIVGKSGDYKANVLKVNIPRNDIHVSIDNLAVPTAFGFGGWFAVTKGDGGDDVLMGDLVLLQEEVNPVMSALLDHGIEVTALHNHFFWETPRIYFMHIHGHGKPTELAEHIKPALDLIGKSAQPASTTPATTPAKTMLDTAKIARIVGHDGEQNGAVYKITVGRDDIKLKEMGAVINARMGLNTWAAFYGTNDDAVVAGDVAMLEDEVTPTLKALRSHGLDVVAIHNHMIGTQPAVIFLHYWGRGSADKLASGFKAALDQSGKRSHQ